MHSDTPRTGSTRLVLRQPATQDHKPCAYALLRAAAFDHCQPQVPPIDLKRARASNGRCHFMRRT